MASRNILQGSQIQKTHLTAIVDLINQSYESVKANSPFLSLSASERISALERAIFKAPTLLDLVAILGRFIPKFNFFPTPSIFNALITQLALLGIQEEMHDIIKVIYEKHLRLLRRQLMKKDLEAAREVYRNALDLGNFGEKEEAKKILKNIHAAMIDSLLQADQYDEADFIFDQLRIQCMFEEKEDGTLFIDLTMLPRGVAFVALRQGLRQIQEPKQLFIKTGPINGGEKPGGMLALESIRDRNPALLYEVVFHEEQQGFSAILVPYNNLEMEEAAPHSAAAQEEQTTSAQRFQGIRRSAASASLSPPLEREAKKCPPSDIPDLSQISLTRQQAGIVPQPHLAAMIDVSTPRPDPQVTPGLLPRLSVLTQSSSEVSAVDRSIKAPKPPGP